MMRMIEALSVLMLTGCKEETAQDTTALPLTAQAVGHFCKLNLLEHEGQKGQAHLSGLPSIPSFFSQVRDDIGYAPMPEQSHEILVLWVNDMGALCATGAVPGANNWITGLPKGTSRTVWSNF